MFRSSFIAQELLRRRGRTFLPAFGPGPGIAPVVAVTSPRGLDRAQDRVHLVPTLYARATVETALDPLGMRARERRATASERLADVGPEAVG